MIVFTLNGEARYYENFGTITAATGLTKAKYSPPNDTVTVGGRCRAAFITTETAAINFTMDGTTPTATAGTNLGHTLAKDQSLVIQGWENIKNFQMINSVAGNGAIVKVTYLF